MTNVDDYRWQAQTVHSSVECQDDCDSDSSDDEDRSDLHRALEVDERQAEGSELDSRSKRRVGS